MTVPGSNLLRRAHYLLGFQTFQYLAYATRTLNSIGLYTTTFSPAQTLQGSVQPVARRLYEYMGLNFQKDYYLVYVSQNVLDVDRGVSGDQIIYNGLTLNCESLTKWFPQDGWVEILCVRVTP
jgi:hypothetical protein